MYGVLFLYQPRRKAEVNMRKWKSMLLFAVLSVLLFAVLSVAGGVAGPGYAHTSWKKPVRERQNRF